MAINPLLEKLTYFAFAEEISYGAGKGSAFAGSDIVPVLQGGSISKSYDTIDRPTLNGHLFDCDSVQGQLNVSASIPLEAKLTTGDIFVGHVLYKQAFGSYSQAGVDLGADVDKVAYTIEENATGTDTGYALYKMRDISEATTSIVGREYRGGDTDNVYESVGMVVSSLNLTLPSADILNATFSMEGISQDQLSGQTALTSTDSCSNGYFIGKTQKLILDGVAYSASDISMTFNNVIYNNQSTDSDGINAKIETGKSIEITFSGLHENADQSDAYDSDTTSTFYLELVNQVGDEIVIYFPHLKRTGVDANVDGGVYKDNLTFKAGIDATTNEVAYIAVKKV